MKEDFRSRPGFLRWLTFNDGPHGYALGLWRTTEDVEAFVAGSAHRAMVREQRERPFEYSQFAGVWAAHSVGVPGAVLRTVPGRDRICRRRSARHAAIRSTTRSADRSATLRALTPEDVRCHGRARLEP